MKLKLIIFIGILNFKSAQTKSTKEFYLGLEQKKSVIINEGVNLKLTCPNTQLLHNNTKNKVSYCFTE